jgi:hypothetical protein
MVCDAARPLLASTGPSLLLFPTLLLLLWCANGVCRAATALQRPPVLLFSVLLKHRCIALCSSRDAAALINCWGRERGYRCTKSKELFRRMLDFVVLPRGLACVFSAGLI